MSDAERQTAKNNRKCEKHQVHTSLEMVVPDVHSPRWRQDIKCVISDMFDGESHIDGP